MINFYIDKKILSNILVFFQFSLIVLHIITSDLIYYIGLVFFIPLNIIYLFDNLKITIKQIFYFLFFIFIFLVFGLIGHTGLNELFVSWFMLVLSITLSLIVFEKSNIKIVICFLYFLNLYVLFVGYQNEFDPLFGNDIFLNKSRNYVSATIALFTLLYLTLARYYNKKIDPFLLILLLVNCIFLYGRSGIVVGFFILLLGLYYRFGKTFTILMSLAALIFLGLIYEFILSATNFSEGLDTPRTLLREEYLNSIFISSYDFVFGADIQHCCNTIAFYGFNPHNSFILAHSIYGLSSVLFVILASLLVFLSKRVDFIFIYIILLLRYSLDSIGIFTYYDIVLFVVLIACYKVKFGGSKNA